MWSFDRDVLNSGNSFSFSIILLESEPDVVEECGDTAGRDTELHPDHQHGDGGGGDHL